MFDRSDTLSTDRKEISTALQNQIILFALILKVITSICNETILHLIVKSTLAKLCGIGIVYLFFSVDRNEVSWRNVFLSSTMINKMLDK